MTKTTRRQFLGSSAAVGTSVLTSALSLSSGALTRSASAQEKPRSKVERLGIGSIGMRYQGSVITEKAALYGDVVAIADVDKHVP